MTRYMIWWHMEREKASKRMGRRDSGDYGDHAYYKNYKCVSLLTPAKKY